MRVMTWNTRSATYPRIKDVIDEIARERNGRPDIVVLTEVAEPSEADRDLLGATCSSWRGLPGKGVAAFTFGSYQLHPAPPSVMPESPPDGYKAGEDSELKERVLPWILPVEVDSGIAGVDRIRLVAAWPSNRGTLRPLSLALERTEWSTWLTDHPVIAAGDFNHHWKWDLKSTDERNHAHTEKLLRSYGSVSAYHVASSVKPGNEPPTMWTAYNEDKPHHIDYVYAPSTWIPNDPAAAFIGSWEHYVKTKLSDHSPVVVDLFPTT